MIALANFLSKAPVERVVFHPSQQRQFDVYADPTGSEERGDSLAAGNHLQLRHYEGRLYLKFCMTNADITFGLGSGLPGVTSHRHKELLHA